MLRHEYQYIDGEGSKANGTALESDSETIQNRDKMIKYAFLVGVGIVGLFAIGFANRNHGNNR